MLCSIGNFYWRLKIYERSYSCTLRPKKVAYDKAEFHVAIEKQNSFIIYRKMIKSIVYRCSWCLKASIHIEARNRYYLP